MGNLISPTRRRVLFVTTNYTETIRNGPDLYVKLLESLFTNDAEFEFHILAFREKNAPSSTGKEHLHLLDRTSDSPVQTYQQLESAVLAMRTKLGSNCLVHLNSGHFLSDRAIRILNPIVQINDTEVCQWRPAFRSLRLHGLRRNLALAWRQRRERAACKSAKLIICNSQFTASAIRRFYNLSPSKIQVVYKAIELQPFFEIASSRQPLITGGTPNLLFVGSNWLRKGLDTLLNSIAILNQDAGQKIRATVAGHSDCRRESQIIAKLIEQRGLAEQVTFLGVVNRPQLLNALSNADLFVLPSREEALGVAAIEAMASGLPVIASNVGGLPEVVCDDSLGILVPPENPKDLARAIVHALRKPNDHTTVPLRMESTQRFSSTKLFQEIRQVYAQAFT